MPVEVIIYPRVIVSTDICGYFGKPCEWKKAWEFIPEEDLGYEMLGVNFMPGFHDVPALLEQAATMGRTPTGIHGRMGKIAQALKWKEKVLTNAIEHTLIPSQSLPYYAHEVTYVTLHQPEFEKPEVRQAFKDNRSSIKVFFIENQSGQFGNLAATRGTAEDMQSDGVTAGVCLDFVHYLKEHCLDLSKITAREINKLIREIEITATTVGPNGLIPMATHIPVGESARDSLHLESMIKLGRNAFVDIALTLNRYHFPFRPIARIIECQPKQLKRLVYSSENEFTQTRERNQPIYEMLDEAGMFPLIIKPSDDSVLRRNI